MATIVMHKQKASSMFKVVESSEEEENLEIPRVAQRLKSDIKDLKCIDNRYSVLDDNEILETCSLI